MSTENANKEKVIGKHQRIEEKSNAGVPFAVVTLLVALALVCGSVAGYFVASKFSGTAKELADAKARIEEYDLMVAELYSSQVESDALEQAEILNTDPDGSAALAGEDVAEPVGAEVYVVVEFEGGRITSQEAAAEYDRELADRAMFGEDVSLSSDAILDEVLRDMAGERIAYLKAAELGLTQYTDREKKEIEGRAQSEYDATIAFHAGMDADEESTAQVKAYLADSEGYTLDSVRAEIESEYWMEKLMSSVTSAVKVDADDIATLYSQMVTEQTAAYDADPTAFEAALISGEIVVYNPAGYRTVKQICIPLDAEAIARVSELNALIKNELDETVIAGYQAEIDGIYADIEARAAQAVSEFRAGADFDELIESYGDACAPSAGAFSSTGYYISEKTVMWPDEFVTASMALASPGDVSEPVRSAMGVHVARYIANVQPGSIPLGNVSARLTTQTQEVAEETAWQTQLDAWMTELNVQYHPELMK